jgi:PAS domain S-box-containing protein
MAYIVESSEDAIYSRTLDGIVSSWNAAAERIFGFRAEEIIGKSSAILLPKERAGETSDFLKRVKLGQRVEHVETIRVRKDGVPLTVFLTVSPIRDASKRVVGASTIARDITLQRRLEAELIEIGEQERKRVGHDLHDGLGQQLAGIELICRSLVRSLAERHIPEAQTAQLLVEQIREATAQTRALSQGLVPVMDRPDSLMLALETLSTTTNAISNVQCVFQCEEPVLISKPAVAIHLFRIAQEALANAIRHGHANKIIIQLARQSSRVILDIQDNGCGFQQDTERDAGMGLRIMCYRADVLGGALKIANTQPNGVKVRCVVSLVEKKCVLE